MDAPGLAFEKPIQDLQGQLDALLAVASRDDEAIRELGDRLAKVTREVYDSLTPWQTVRVARHEDRPQTADYLDLVFDEFVELHGDRRFGDDPALLTGFAKLGGFKVMVIGHQKGRNTKERTLCSFGCAHPEGYRKALLKMKLAAKYGVPVITLIDTPGAYPGVGAEERGQAQAIAENMFEMSRLETPIICVVIGEGGSGGALGIGVGDRVAMLEHAYYSVISPEGCAGILWKSNKFAEKAAEALRFTSKNLKAFGVVEEVIKEPLGGAHRDHHQMAANLRLFLLRSLRELSDLDTQELLSARYARFRTLGDFWEGLPPTDDDLASLGYRRDGAEPTAPVLKNVHTD
jgi:acetyl-CoA carboxylase carboxyl transferase subunit alpha